MITNREMRTERLLETAVDEVVASALDNDLDPEAVAATLRERAAAVEAGDWERETAREE